VIANSNNSSTQDHKWVLVCLLLLAVTWLPLLGIHVYKTSLSDSSTGTVVVVFSPSLSSRELFQEVMDANGSLVRPIRWFPDAWIVHSLESGFAGRLKERGAWGVYSTDLLNPEAILSCIGISAPPST
jgi:hypothetical protein